MSRPRATGKQAEPVVFRGPPDRLASLLPRTAVPAEPAEAEPAVSLEGADVQGLRVRSPARAGEEAREAMLRLAGTTPPGRYAGSAEIGGREVPIVAEVEPRPRLRAQPRRLELEAEPGATATVEVTLLNVGNVSCEVSKASTFCLFDGHGVEHAVWAALSNEPPKGRQRIDVLLDDLAASHGGLVEARVGKAVRVDPGAAQEVQLKLDFSDRLRPGHRYSGAWETDGLRLPVRVSVPARRRARAAKATQ